MTEVYRYDELKDEEIRLMELLPDKFVNEIRVILRPINLIPGRFPSDYHALSYVWGSPENAKFVTVVAKNKQYTLKITSNLYTALKYLRHSDQSRTLWIDAICINQDSDEERSNQVAKMAEIYRLAFRVVIWLGPEAKDSDIAMHALKSLAYRIQLDHLHAEIKLSDPNDTADGLLDMTKEPQYDNKTWLALNHLLNRTWFTRVWVWQEVFVSFRWAHLTCGYHSLAWTFFTAALTFFIQKPWPSNIPEFGSLALQAFRIAQFCLSGRSNWPFVLHHTREAKCSDKRDKVYGVLHLVDPRLRLGMKADYTKSVQSVFRDLTLKLAVEMADLSLLSECELLDCELEGEMYQIPSWIPNWSVSRYIRSIPPGKPSWGALGKAQYSVG